MYARVQFFLSLFLLAPQSANAAPVAAPTAALKSNAVASRLITKVVGELSDRIVTSREIQINEALEQAISDKTSGLRIMSVKDPAFPGDVTRVLNEWAVYLEAQSFSAKPPLRAEAQKRLRAVLDVWTPRADWQSLEVSEGELREQMERKLLAKEFIRLKTDASQAPITDADASAYFKKNRLKFGNLPFEDFRENIKTFLAKQQTDRRLKEWFEVLNRKYRTRNYVSG